MSQNNADFFAHPPPPAETHPCARQPHIATRTRNGIYHALDDLLTFAETSLPRKTSWQKFWHTYCRDLDLPPSGLEANGKMFLQAEAKAASVRRKYRHMATLLYQMLFYDHLAHETTTATDVRDAINSAFRFVAEAIRSCEADHRYRNLAQRWREYHRAVQHINELLAQTNTGWRLEPAARSGTRRQNTHRFSFFTPSASVVEGLIIPTSHNRQFGALRQKTPKNTRRISHHFFASSHPTPMAGWPTPPPPYGWAIPSQFSPFVLTQTPQKRPPCASGPLLISPNPLENKHNFQKTPKKQGKNRGKLGVN